MYGSDVVTMGQCLILRLPVHILSQHFHEEDMWRLRELCRLKSEFRVKQLKYNVRPPFSCMGSPLLFHVLDGCSSESLVIIE